MYIKVIYGIDCIGINTWQFAFKILGDENMPQKTHANLHSEDGELSSTIFIMSSKGILSTTFLMRLPMMRNS